MPLPCAHCVLTTPVAAPTAAPEPVVSEPPKLRLVPVKKRGRPAKNGVAMTAAERKQKQRRSDTIAEVLAIPDSHGRLHNERSGEADRISGVSEMERIVAAQDRDEDGRRVKPTGQGPDVSVDEKTDVKAEPFDRGAAREYIRGRLDDDLDAKKLNDKISEIAQWAFFSLTGYAGCRLCGYQGHTTQGMEDHVWGAYERGLRLESSYWKEQEIVRELEHGDAALFALAQQRVNVAGGRWFADRHIKTIRSLMRDRKPIM
jgi:hypothetical protein